ncbi:MAG: hypothetical protein CMG63_03920 [Candidatus Marinimicrobia bacterium]|nr:hypothetical protein [Candidatus Neomarinimicrobiota bacterium]
MSDNFIKVVILVFWVPAFMNSMTITVTDSVIYHSDSGHVRLSNSFVIESSIKIFSNDSLVKPIKIFPIEGRLLLNGLSDNSLLIVEYDYLEKEIPKLVGPKWKKLPTLEPLLSIVEEEDFELNIPTDSNKAIYTSGSFFRSLTLSPYGSSDFQGGVQMQLNGKLLKDINISGVLTDQSFPLQAEGSTQELKDFDKVFLKVQHPNFELEAGDIEYSFSDNMYTINRKLEGLKNQFHYKKWSSSSIYANSKGQFHFIEIKGRDGDQGPYQLLDKDGNREISILSGTEKVWINGERLKRGKNYDYTIDYALSEIYFTPKRLIDFDTDIFIEYQYSNFEYQKGFRGITMKNNFGNSGYFSIGIFDEFDQLNRNDFQNNKFNEFSSNDSLTVNLNNAYVDSTGDYIYLDSIFVYDPLNTYADFTRYTVTFILSPGGNYQRRVSDDSKIFYQYIENSNKIDNEELYSPYRKILSPTAQQFGKAKLSLNLADYFTIEGQVAGSRLNQNTIRNSEFSNGSSYFVNINIDTVDLDFLKIKLMYKNQKRSKEYLPLGRENQIMQTRLWNLDEILLKNSDEHYLQSEFIIDKLGLTSLELAELSHENLSRKRFRYSQSFLNQNYKSSYIDYTYVDNSIANFYRALFNLERSGLRYSPNFSFITEQNNLDYRFRKIGAGVKVKLNKAFVTSGIEKRIDEEYQFSDKWSAISNDYIGYTNINRYSKNGWKKDIVFKKRIKKSNVIQDFNYSLLDLTASWKNQISPFTCFIDIKKEETLSQNRMVVYEYIGPGLGNYRYDSILNTYIHDINGDHLSYSIKVGSREPNTIFLGSQRFTIDLSQNKFFPQIFIRSQINQEFKGKDFDVSKIGESSISDTSISKSLFFTRNEIIFSNYRLAKIWFQLNKNLEGFDPRGNNINVDKEIGIENIFKLSKNNSIKNKVDFHDYSIDSKVFPNRKREIYGFYNNFTLQTKLENKLDFDLSIIYGFDRGKSLGEPFKVEGKGLKGKILFYLKQNGRLETEITFLNVEGEKNSKTLPPEVIKGYAYGQSIRTNSRLHFLINKSLSINLNLNFINDSRYKNFITTQGEVRAYF